VGSWVFCGYQWYFWHFAVYLRSIILVEYLPITRNCYPKVIGPMLQPFPVESSCRFTGLGAVIALGTKSKNLQKAHVASLM
jgi:hypothetical protein